MPAMHERVRRGGQWERARPGRVGLKLKERENTTEDDEREDRVKATCPLRSTSSPFVKKKGPLPPREKREKIQARRAC